MILFPVGVSAEFFFTELLHSQPTSWGLKWIYWTLWIWSKCSCPVHWIPRKMIMSYHEALNMGINISWGFAIIMIMRWVHVDFSVITRIQKYDSLRNHCRSSLSSFWGLHPRSGLLTLTRNLRRCDRNRVLSLAYEAVSSGRIPLLYP